MTRKQLFKELNRICNEMSYNYNINCGGCCFVAACLAENLEKLNIPFKVIHYNLSGCHYAIKVSDRYINRDEYYSYEIKEIMNCSSDDLYEIYNNNNWNKCYNKKWNLIVSTRIKSICNKYANSRA